jgi:hypothetical protein
MAVDISQVNKSESPAECLYAITFTLISGTGITMKIFKFFARSKENMTATGIKLALNSSFLDPWHFGMNPDPRIRAYDYWIRIRRRILVF